MIALFSSQICHYAPGHVTRRIYILLRNCELKELTNVTYWNLTHLFEWRNPPCESILFSFELTVGGQRNIWERVRSQQKNKSCHVDVLQNSTKFAVCCVLLNTTFVLYLLLKCTTRNFKLKIGQFNHNNKIIYKLWIFTCVRRFVFFFYISKE